jgi:hypothetical protein
VPDARLNRRRLLGGGAALGASALALTGPMALPAAAAARPPAPYLPITAHLIEAQQLIDYLRLPESPVDNNTYKSSAEANVVTWGQPGQADTWIVRAQCASFLTAVIKRTYPSWATDAFFATYFGSSSPFARDYRTVWGGPPIPHFQPVTAVVDLQPGDLIAIDYRNGQTTNTGHVVMVRQVKPAFTSPSGTLNFPGQTQYPVEIVDCTSDPHGVYGLGDYFAYPDTRLATGVENDGAGYGHMFFYASEDTGEFARYRWSVNTSSAGTYPVSERPISAVRVV